MSAKVGFRDAFKVQLMRRLGSWGSRLTAGDVEKLLAWVSKVIPNRDVRAQAEKLHHETLESRRRVLGEDHRHTLVSMYNLACLEARRGNRAKAMDWLTRSIDAGRANPDWMAADPDLETLHGPEFDAHQVDFAELSDRLAAYREQEKTAWDQLRQEQKHECKLDESLNQST